MNVISTHHVDASQPDARGKYEWRYAYTIYEFSNDSGTRFVARSYDDDPTRASFLSAIHADGSEEFYSAAWYDSELFLAAARYLLLEAKKKKIMILTSQGYAKLARWVHSWALKS
jgi:hypothetical protein